MRFNEGIVIHKPFKEKFKMLQKESLIHEKVRDVRQYYLSLPCLLEFLIFTELTAFNQNVNFY